MNDKPEPAEPEDEERKISTVEGLAAYLSENRQLATALVGELADEVETEGYDPINDILEKGYEDSFYMDDLMGFDEGFETIVITPMIEIGTDWEQPFDNHGLGASVDSLLEGVGVDEELAAEFRQSLMQECLRLVERKGRIRPNSGFVDIFGLKVFEAYKPLQPALQEELQLRRQDEDEDDWSFSTAGELLRDALASAIERAAPLIADWMAETIQAEGEELAFNALERMASQHRADSHDA
jgi:hypothetical protein